MSQQVSDSLLRRILNELQNINKRVINLEQEMRNIDKRVMNLEREFDSFRKEIRGEITAVKTANGKATTKLNNEMRTLTSTVANLQTKLKPFTSQGSVIVELGINNAVRDYYANLFLTANIRDIKQQTINRLNHATKKDHKQLLVFRPNVTNFTTTNAFTEFDGLFHFEIAGHRELIIVESKMIFTPEHLKHKYEIFLNFQKLLSTPKSKFANQNYCVSLMDIFGNYNQITVVYGALHWEMDLEDLYIDDDRVIYDPDHDIYSEPDEDHTAASSIYNPNIRQAESHLNPNVVKMTCAPNVKFVTNTISGFKVYNSLDCMSGGNTEEIEDTAWDLHRKSINEKN